MTIDEALALNEDDLYLALGRELLGSGAGMGSFDTSWLRSFAREQFELLVDGVRYNLCGPDGPKVNTPGAVLAAMGTNMGVEASGQQQLYVICHGSSHAPRPGQVLCDGYRRG